MQNAIYADYVKLNKIGMFIVAHAARLAKLFRAEIAFLRLVLDAPLDDGSQPGRKLFQLDRVRHFARHQLIESGFAIPVRADAPCLLRPLILCLLFCELSEMIEVLTILDHTSEVKNRKANA